jgi:hypothetical protein
MWILLEERRGLHDLAGLAIAALRHVVGAPGALHGMRAVLAQPLDRRDLLTRRFADGGDAGPHRLAVEMHGARAAGADTAAEFCAVQPEDIAQRPEERHVGVDIDGVLDAVYAQIGHDRILAGSAVRIAA